MLNIVPKSKTNLNIGIPPCICILIKFNKININHNYCQHPIILYILTQRQCQELFLINSIIHIPTTTSSVLNTIFKVIFPFLVFKATNTLPLNKLYSECIL